MANYKKRGRAGWVGKKEAKGKIHRERNYEKQEIRQALQEIEEGDDYRYLHKAKRVKNEKARLENTIRWYERTIEKYKQREWGIFGSGWLESGYRKALAKYKEKFGDKGET